MYVITQLTSLQNCDFSMDQSSWLPSLEIGYTLKPRVEKNTCLQAFSPVRVANAGEKVVFLVAAVCLLGGNFSIELVQCHQFQHSDHFHLYHHHHFHINRNHHGNYQELL